MLNIKRKILTTRWCRVVDDVPEELTTYGKVNPVKMLSEGWNIINQDLKYYELSEEEFARAAERKEE